MSPVDDHGSGEPDEEVRQALIAAAIECFATDGYDATTTWNIAAKAGVSARVLYQQFGSKKAVFAAAYDQTYSDFFRHLAEALQGKLQIPDGSLTGWMNTVIDALTSFVTGDPVVGAFIAVAPIDTVRTAELRQVIYNDPQEQMHSVMVGMVESLAATGRLHPDASPSDVSYLILAILLGANLMLNLFKLGDPAEMAKALKFFAEGVLFKD